MVLYVSKYCSYAVIQRAETFQKNIQPLIVAKIEPQKGELNWEHLFSFYQSDFDAAKACAERLEGEQE